MNGDAKGDERAAVARMSVQMCGGNAASSSCERPSCGGSGLSAFPRKTLRGCAYNDEDCGGGVEAVTELPEARLPSPIGNTVPGAKTELNDVGGEGDEVGSALNMEGSGEEVEDDGGRVSRGFEAESAAVQRARSVVISHSISAMRASSGSTVLDGGLRGEGEGTGAVGTTRRTALLDDRGDGAAAG
jgi:hypothetical protein